MLKPLDHALAIACNLFSGGEGSVEGRHVGELRPVFHAVDRNFEKGLADAKDVMAQKPNGAITIVDRPLDEPSVGNLTDVALRGAQHGGPFRDQLGRRKRRVPGAL